MILLAAAFWNGCSTVPVTGRSQLNLLSPGEEVQLGLTSFQQTKKETPISADAVANALVQKVGQRIAAVAGADMPNAQWEFVVFANNQQGGGTLPFLRTHPTDAVRIRQLSEWMPEAKVQYQPAK